MWSTMVLIRASDEQFVRIQAVVNEIDRAALVGASELHSISIDPSRAAADDVARVLQDCGAVDARRAVRRQLQAQGRRSCHARARAR